MDADEALVLARTLMRKHRLKDWVVEINPRLHHANGRTGYRLVGPDGRALPRHLSLGNLRGRPMLYDTRNGRWLPSRGDVGLQSLIQLSRSYVERSNRRAVQETILHEIAHALVPGERAHSPKWKAIARRIGANPNWLNEDSSWRLARKPPSRSKRPSTKARQKATTK